MVEISVSEKIEILKKVMTSSIAPLLALFIIVFIGFLFITTNRHNRGESKKVYILLYAVALIALIIRYSTYFMNFIDYFMNHVFILIYFPNLAVYLLAIIITNIIMWKTLFKSDDKALKVINTLAFCSIHYLFILLLSVIASKGLDIFEMTSIYGNKTAYTLIELSSFTFVIWILLMTIYLTIRKLQTKNKGIVLEEYKVEPIIHKNKRIVPVEAPIEAYSNTVISKEQRKDIPKAKQDPMIRIYDSMLTVEDYKLLLELLKEHRHKEEIKQEELERYDQADSLLALYGKAK